MRRTETSTLAFLDVMACGLGAVILILVVLKQQAPIDSPIDSVGQHPQQAAATAAELDQLQDDLTRALASRDAAKSNLDEQQQITARLNNDIDLASTALAAAAAQSAQLNSAIKNATTAVENLSTEPPNAPVETPTVTQPDYLIGLKVSGRKIAILLDSSASMSARELRQIIHYKARPGADRKGAEKWVNAMNAVWWLVARAPTSAAVQIASFNETTSFHTDGWTPTTDSATLTTAKSAMASLFPDGSTNLQVAVDAALKTGADSIYIITDGLPTTAPGGRSLLGLDGCGSKLQKRQQVTGKCRISLFQRTVGLTLGKPVRVSVVLMPLEGDPDAAPLFSKWALSKGGMLLSAAKDWP